MKDTHGVIVYQDQVMQIAAEAAGFSLGAADLLRAAMGKKDKRKMAAQRQRFIAGAAERESSRRPQLISSTTSTISRAMDSTKRTRWPTG